MDGGTRRAPPAGPGPMRAPTRVNNSKASGASNLDGGTRRASLDGGKGWQALPWNSAEPVPLGLVAERGLRDLQRVRRGALVPARALDGVREDLALELEEGTPEAQHLAGRARRAHRPELE